MKQVVVTGKILEELRRPNEESTTGANARVDDVGGRESNTTLETLL